eukprot:3822283-Amphidinium_carterae.1
MVALASYLTRWRTTAKGHLVSFTQMHVDELAKPGLDLKELESCWKRLDTYPPNRNTYNSKTLKI